MESTHLRSLAQCRRAVAYAMALTTGTPLAPQPYERYLLALYQRGLLTLEEVEEQLQLSVYQVLYHSRAMDRPSENQLQHLLEQARSYNADHQITGLLLYSAGRYVQVLEGREADVRALYARIQQDPRHEQVVTVREGPGAQRRFADWRMGFGYVEATAVEQLLHALHVPAPAAVHLEDPHLWAVLEAFRAHPLAAEVVPFMPRL